MSAFDTSSNSPSVSFSNNYGCAVFAPAATDQHVYGFQRNGSGAAERRYFELKVVDGGGDPGKLLLGFIVGGIGGSSTPPPVDYGNVWNGPDKYLYRSNSITNSTSALSTTTLTTGDVWMFLVAWEADNQYRNASLSVVGSFTSASTPAVGPAVSVAIGKNGTWLADPVLSYWRWPGFGYNGWIGPLVARGATSASAASVELQVTTASFAYPLPSTALAWGDGPQGGTSVSADASVAWDPTLVSSDPNATLSASNYYGVVSNTSSFGRHAFFHSTILPTTGKRVVELRFGASSGSADASNDWKFGFGDASTSVTDTLETSTKKYGIENVQRKLYRRGSDISASVSGMFNPALGSSDVPSAMFFFDFGSSRYWISAGSQNGFISDKGAGVASPYEGVAGLTFTSSVGLRMFAEVRGDYFTAPKSNYMKINTGQANFSTYPLLPGWVSMNGNLAVDGVGAHWDQTVAPASASFETSYLVARPNAQQIMVSNNSKNSGKYYFEVFRLVGVQTSAGTMSFAVGIRPATATTVTAANVGSLLDTGIYFDNAGAKKSRYGTTSTWSGTFAQTAVGTDRQWHGVAVDFDSGKVWGGTYNKVTNAMNWGGGDPAAGTGEHFTFTAGTAMRIAVLTGDIATPVILVAEANNVIGIPTGFDPWNGSSTPGSATATPSGSTGSGGILWPYGVIT